MDRSTRRFRHRELYREHSCWSGRDSLCWRVIWLR